MRKYEEHIIEIEQYIDNCKAQKFSNNNNIIVNKQVIQEYLSELRMNVPEEIKKCQKIKDNREHILNAAQQQAEFIIEQARMETEALVSEHEIMQQAYEVAQATVDQASEQAQQILDSAVNDANDIRVGAMQYTDELLANLENIIIHTMENFTSRYESLMKALNTTLEVVSANRNELYPQENIEEDTTDITGTEDFNDTGDTGFEQYDEEISVNPDTEYEDYTVKLD